eukprot:430904-Prymnesium_polylepis.1
MASVCERRSAAPALPPVYRELPASATDNQSYFAERKTPQSYVPGGCERISKIIPDYDDPTYLRKFEELHRRVAVRMSELKANYANVDLVFFQVCPGTTGDNTPYHWPPKGQDDFSYVNYMAAYLTGDANSAEYYAYARWAQTTVYAVFDRVLGTSAPNLILNGGGSGKDGGGVFAFDWAEANFPAFYLKRGQEGHQFQGGGERRRLQGYSHKMHVVKNGVGVRARGEFSNEVCWGGIEGNRGHLDGNNDTCVEIRQGQCVPLAASCKRQLRQFHAMAQFIATVRLDFWQVGRPSVPRDCESARSECPF